MKRTSIYLLNLITVLYVTLACQSGAIPSAEINPQDAPSPQDESSSVLFKIQAIGRRKVKGGDEVTWLATHDSKSGVAKFKLRIVLKKLRVNPPMAFSEGTILRETGSQPAEFLRQVAHALEAKDIDTGKPKVNVLDFTLALLGEHLSRGTGRDRFAGGFTSEPLGEWIATKVFVADGEGEFFLNLNPKEGVGEISIKDADYGDVVLSELARVF